MKIQIGEITMGEVSSRKIIPTKTNKYLLPCLKEYGQEFMVKINSVFKVAAGIGDIVVSNRGMKHEKHLFILLDSTIATRFFIVFLPWVKNQPMYEDDYVFGDIQTSPLHMVILKFPEGLSDSFDRFKEGKYSKMFEAKTTYQLFGANPEVLKVLIKDRDYKIVFTKKLNKIYGTEITPEEYDGELDLPPKEDVETFNHHLKH